MPALPLPDPALLANRELIRPIGYRRAAPGLVPFTAAWYDELEQKRYQRHGVWLPAALEFGRHPGESLLLLGPGVGSDAAQYIRTGTPVTIGVTDLDNPELVRQNLARHALPTRVVDVSAANLPFADGTFDVVTWNALYDPAPPDPARIDELFRVLKSGGKVIGLFPAWYDAGYWQDLILPLQWLYWRRPADPTKGVRTTARRFAPRLRPPSQSTGSASVTSAVRNCRTRGACSRSFSSNADRPRAGLQSVQAALRPHGHLHSSRRLTTILSA